MTRNSSIGAALMMLLLTSMACNLTLNNPTVVPAPTITTLQPTKPTEPPTVAPPTLTPTHNGPTEVIKPTPSYVPATATLAPPTISPVPTANLSAKVCPTCESLRVREAPNTTSAIIAQLPYNTEIKVIGRTTDGNWFRVVMSDGRAGWGYAPFVVVSGDINTVNIINITGETVATNAPPAAAQIPAGAPLDGNIVTGVTSTSRQIFLNGQAKGNLPGVFTRVGDSLTAHSAFLHQFANTAYDLGAYNYLQPAVSFFSGLNARGGNPFLATSLAEHNNWTTADILNPANAPSGTCSSGETPLSCEYRLVKPSVSLILIGTNDAARDVSPAQYQTNLQQIVQTSIDMGVIPVLSTLPPKHLDAWNNGRVDQFNGIIVAVAHANDIPLWNFWLALQKVPNQGIVDDGVHLSIPPDGQNVIFDSSRLAYGFPVRNLTALQVLDTLRRQVLYGGNSGGQVIAPANVPSQGLASGAPTARPCDGAPLPQLIVGQTGHVTAGLPNKLRAGPHKSDTVIGNMPGGAAFSVVGGPICADGLRWWQVTYNGLNAWTADGQGSESWLQP
ncbi:MAG: SH3 domain-containing protein [Chloroflexota bacterium]